MRTLGKGIEEIINLSLRLLGIVLFILGVAVILPERLYTVLLLGSYGWLLLANGDFQRATAFMVAGIGIVYFTDRSANGWQ